MPIEELADRAETAILERVKEYFDPLSPEEKQVLKWISICGGTLHGGRDALQRTAQKEGMLPYEELVQVLGKLAGTRLVDFRHSYGRQVYWEIPQGYREAVRMLVWTS